jgi:hypothetical protein
MSMLRRIESLGLAAVVCGLVFVLSADESKAQGPPVVTTYYPAQPVVSYVPERRGLFGLRVGYRPVVTYATPAVPTVAVPAPVTTYYAPSPTVTTYYAPPAPVVTAPAPVTTYYAPPAPVVTAPAPVTVRYAPAPVVTYYPPLILP